jgi:Mrp family chromosome partitioning ATPase
VEARFGSAGVEEPAVPRRMTPQARTVAVDLARLRTHRVVSQDETGPATHGFKLLRTQCLRLLSRNGFNSLAVVSPTSGGGNTVTAVNLAISLADDSDHSALLVDQNLRRPRVHDIFGFQVERGIESYLARVDGEVAEAIVHPEPFRKLSLLPASAPMPRAAELLAADSTRRLTAEINARYTNRIVLYDLPPLLEVADALGFVRCVDAVLLVVREGRTRRDDVARALHLLRDTPVVGTVLNASRERRSA